MAIGVLEVIILPITHAHAHEDEHKGKECVSEDKQCRGLQGVQLIAEYQHTAAGEDPRSPLPWGLLRGLLVH